MEKQRVDQYVFEDINGYGLGQREKNKYALRVGKFLFSFSEVESELNHAISRLIDQRADYVGYTVIAALRYRAKVDLFNKLFGFHVNWIKPGMRKTLKTLVKDLEDFGTFRNNIAHANWESLDKKGYVRVRIETDEEGVNLVRRKVSIENLDAEIQKAEDLAMKLWEFSDSLSDS